MLWVIDVLTLRLMPLETPVEQQILKHWFNWCSWKLLELNSSRSWQKCRNVNSTLQDKTCHSLDAAFIAVHAGGQEVSGGYAGFKNTLGDQRQTVSQELSTGSSSMLLGVTQVFWLTLKAPVYSHVMSAAQELCALSAEGWGFIFERPLWAAAEQLRRQRGVCLRDKLRSQLVICWHAYYIDWQV